MDIFIARQPIFDSGLNVHAYELLFRSSLENAYGQTDSHKATSRVILGGLLVLDIEAVTGGKPAYINMGRESLLQGIGKLLPVQSTVIEVLETVEPDREVLEAIRELKDAGYTIALDDFVYSPAREPMIDLADVIKVDFLSTEAKQRIDLRRRLAGRDIQLVAEKVETREQYEEALNEGYKYFQGYFFSKPVILTGRDLPMVKMHYLDVIQEINRPGLDRGALEQIIRRDISLSYKLLRYANHPAFRLGRQVESIREALLVLEEEEIRRWVSLIAVSSMAEDKPLELVLQTTARGRFCECLAPAFGLEERSQDLFLMGIFSHLDALLDQPIARALEQVKLPGDVKAALLGDQNDLSPVLDVVTAYERADWDQLSALEQEHDLGSCDIPELYLDAVKWGNEGFERRDAA